MASQEPAPAAVPEWIVTYGDTMSLLLTFFIMLVSTSELRQDVKVQALVDSLHRQFGDSDSVPRLDDGTGAIRDDATPRRRAHWRAGRPEHRSGSASAAPPGTQMLVRNVRPGEQVMIGTAIHFAENSSTLDEADKRDLDAIVHKIAGKPQRIEIRGHTTKRPQTAAGEFRDNWDLAYARSRAVMEYLLAAGIEGRRLRISTAAENEPTNLDGDPVLEKQNARVEVFMVSELAHDFESAPLEQAKLEQAAPAS